MLTQIRRVPGLNERVLSVLQDFVPKLSFPVGFVPTGANSLIHLFVVVVVVDVM